MSFDLPIRIEPLVGLDSAFARRGNCPDCWRSTLQLKFAGNGYEWRQCAQCFGTFVVQIPETRFLVAGLQCRACPRCGRATWNPTDIAQGYCGACHDWT